MGRFVVHIKSLITATAGVGILKPGVPKSEIPRLAELDRFAVLDTLPEKIYDNITALASQICGTPIALVSLIDEKRQWFKSHHGLDATETPRDVSFCGHAILQDDVFEILNSHEDPRFADNPLVTGDPRVIFYAGAPLRTSTGEKVGTLCVIDHKPNKLTPEQAAALRTLADQVVALFELRTATKGLTEMAAREIAMREKLEQSDMRFDLALTAAKMGVWDLNAITGELISSPRVAEIYDVRHEDANTMDLLIERMHPDDRDLITNSVSAALQPTSNGSYDVTFRLQLPSGEIRHLASQGQATFEGEGENRRAIRFIGTVMDVSAIVRAKEALLAERQNAQDANSAKSAFLANMSHEIRSPLGAIMGYSDLLKSSDLNRTEILEHVSVIDRNSQHLLRVIDDILDLAKVEAGKMLLEHIDFSLTDLLADFTSLMTYRARYKGIEFDLNIPATLPTHLVSDPTRIRQILNNVVGNAVKFTDRGRVKLSVLYKNGELEFLVNDTGVGLNQDQIEQLFQPFHQADVSTTRKFGGTGLGLALTRRLSEVLGGQFVLVESQLGKGSTFSAKIRVEVAEHDVVIARAASEFAEQPKKIAQASLKELSGMKVLVVDDSPDNQNLFRILLTKLGADVAMAGDGAEGAELALSSVYDVVLMDIQMPKMDGHEATKLLRSKGYAGPVIALTAHAMIEERSRAIYSGFTAFLSKPIQRSELVRTLQMIKSGELTH